jgi:hypothetical protein
MLRISKNFVTVLLALDLSNTQSLIVVARDVLDVIQNNVPIRFSVIPIVGDDDQAPGKRRQTTVKLLIITILKIQ